MNIAFDKEKLFAAFRDFRSYQPHIAQRYVYIALHRAAQEIDPRQARIEIRNQYDNVEVRVKSRQPDMLKKWQGIIRQKQADALDTYLQQTYYIRYQAPNAQRGVKPDHARFATESKEILLPVAQALYDLLPEDLTGRSHTNLLLSWLQAIPYNTLEDRITANGKGYLPPPQVILNNQGDCDSKSALMASIMRLLLPDAKMIMVYLPQHAMVGISLPKIGDDQTITVDGTSYTLVDPTGPGKLKVGQISPQSQGHINSGMYRTEIL